MHVVAAEYPQRSHKGATTCSSHSVIRDMIKGNESDVGNIDFEQGHSQPHRPGWARVLLSSFFSSNFNKFFLKLYLLSSSFWPSGWASCPPGKALATPLILSYRLKLLINSCFTLFLNLKNCSYLCNHMSD